MGLTAGGFRIPAIPLCQDPYISDTSMFRVSDIDLASMDLPGSLPVSAPCSVSEAPCAPLSLNPPCDLPSGPALQPQHLRTHCSRQLHGRHEQQLDAASASSSLASPLTAGLRCACLPLRTRRGRNAEGAEARQQARREARREASQEFRAFPGSLGGRSDRGLRGVRAAFCPLGLPALYSRP
jgi:hypothetical protein